MSELFSHASRRLMPVAARYLGWRPEEFWRATPEELALSLQDPEAGGGRGAGAMTRADLEHMLEQDGNG